MKRMTNAWVIMALLCNGAAAQNNAAQNSAAQNRSSPNWPLPSRPAQQPAVDPLARFDRLIENVLKEHRLAGASLAIAKDGKLVLARGYGWANVAARQPVRPDTLFCTASITKPFTAVAILKLVETGRLSLDDKIVELLPDWQPLPGHRLVDQRLRTITVRHLLYHAGGWNREESEDGPRNAEEVAHRAGIRFPVDAGVRWRVALGQKLYFTPGTESHYSNFGYIMLRQVVERASGEPYEQYVRAKILAPMGIRQMQIDPSAPAYVVGEARRYAAGGRKLLPGGHNAEMGATGGNWLASAADLVTFLTAVDGSRSRAFLSTKLTDEMLGPPPAPLTVRKNGSHFGMGWDAVRHTKQGWRFSKNGGVPGIMTWMEHLPSGVDWAVMFNTSADEKGENSPVRITRDRFYATIETMQTWPDVDLFRKP